MRTEQINKAKSSMMTAFLNSIKKQFGLSVMVFLGLLFLALDLGATHIVGGNITYRKIGPNRFEVTLELRRDCNLGSPEAQFDDPAAIGIFSTLGALQVGLGTNGMILIPYDDSDTLNNVIESDCGFEGEQVCVEEFKYVQEITLPKRAGGYILSYQRCCRNASLNNVTDPLNTGATYTVRIPESAFDTDNDSPLFQQWPPVYICANEPINFDHSAMDTDGDSLVYSLCVPKDGATFDRPMPQPPGPPPYDDIVWQPPYDINNLLGGTALSIDPQTGLITGTPNTVGQFLVGVCVEEYRNGVLIGRVNRDFQYNVRVCSDPPTADFDAPTSKCDGLEIDFTNTSTSATKYFWDFDYPNGVNTSDLENPTFTFPASGTYDVFLKIIRGTDQCDDSIVKTINVFDAEFNVDFSTELDDCNGDGTVTYTFNDQSTIDVAGVVSTAWNWTITQNGNVSNFTGNPLTIDLNPGDYTVNLEVTASNGCIGEITKNIDYGDFELQPDFDVAISGCGDDETLNIILDDFTVENNPDYNITTIDWEVIVGSSTLNASGDNAVVTIPRSDFVVNLYVLADNGCDSMVTKNFSITSFIPSVDFNFSLDGCNDVNNPLIKLVELSNDSVTYSTVLSYNWTLNGNVLTGDSVIYESINEDTILAELSVEFADGCFASTSKVIRIDEIRPQVNYTWQAEECPTDGNVTIQLSFDDSKVYGYDFDELVWEVGVTGNVSTLTGNPISVTIPKDSSMLVTLSTNFENGCSDVLSNSFYPGDFAQIELVGDTLILCPFEEGEITIGSNPAFTYNWSPQSGLDLSNPSSPIVSVGEDTWYYVTVSDGLCEVNDSIFVDILEQIDLVITGQDYTCAGDVLLVVTGGVGPGFYEWSNTVNFASVIATGDTLSTTFTGASQTFYARFVGEECTANPAGFTVTNETPELDFVDPFEICVFDTVMYRLLNANPDHMLEVQWEDDVHIIGGQNTLEPTIIALPTDMDSFQLFFTVTNQFDCTYQDTLTILIGENPEIDYSYSVVDCDNFEVCFEVIGEFNGFPVWDLGDTTTTDDRFLVEQVCYTYPGPGEYIITLANASAICPFDTLVDTIVLNESIPLFESDNIEVCINSDVAIPLPEGAKGLKFSWCDINGNEISLEDTLKVFVEGDVSYVIKVEDENGCPFKDTLNVNVFDFNYNINLPDVFCAGEEVEVSIDVEGAIDFQYEWLPEDCIVSGGNTANPIIVVDDTKTISVVVTHPILGCVLEEQFTITPTDLTIGVDAEPDAEIFLGDSVEIYVVDQIEGDKYVWSTGDTTGAVIVFPEETTTYSVTVTDIDGCTGEASITITVIQPNCEEDVFLPNAFTPNGDDVNSILYVRSNFVEDMLLIIYNRWNEEVFRSTDIKDGWDGTYEGKELAPDAYAYYLRAVCVDGFMIERSGSINLIR